MNENHLINRQGFKIPLAKIRASDKLQNQLVIDMVENAKAMSEMHSEFKSDCFSHIHDFIGVIAAEYKVNMGNKTGSITLTSYDGRSRVRLGVAPEISFGPEIAAAKQLINSVLNEQLEALGEDAKLLVSIVQDAFSTNNEGNFSKSKIMNLRSKHRLANDSKDWKTAMKALDDAIIVGSTKTYILFDERNEHGAWVRIPLVSKSL